MAAGFNSRAEELLLAGPAGTGKTLANLLRVYWVCRKYAGARALVVRKTRESLTESVLVTWERDVLTPAHPILTRSPTLRRVRQSYRFPNGSEVVLGGMDKPDKVLSSEFDLIYAPEATDLDVTDWETLGGRLRAGRVPYQQLIADCNPTSPHHWLYKRCAGNLCSLVPTTHHDNPRYYDRAAQKWTPAGEQYLARLERMTGARRDRFLKGLWVAAEGVVYDFVARYAPHGHLLPGDFRAPPEWPRVWAVDWGKTAPTCLLVGAVDPHGRIHITREVYKTRLRPDVLGKRAAAWVEAGEEPRPRAIVCDHDEERRADFEAASGLALELADKRDRDKGIEALQARFDFDAGGMPRVLIREGCREHPPDDFLAGNGRPTCLAEELVGYVWDADFLKDEPISENDHACDALRYLARFVDTYRIGPPAEDGPPPAERLLPGEYGPVGAATGW